MSSFVITVFRFIIIVVIQVLLLNNLYLWQSINPLLYLFFIIKLPYQTPRWALLLWGFALGLTIDLFCGTPGMNAAATVLASFARPLFLQMATGRRDPDNTSSPSIREMGSGWFILVVMITLVHHLTLFLLEDFGNGQWGIIFLRTLTSGIATVALLTLTEYLVARVKS
ncbi:MAG TPA: rod shape-determining protein MreD [Bacteroidales bacterium]|nr:MAG: rod shape-determining protein MreD [Bacteroidetes bacterium GWE2_42_24]OFY27492.1 MAG: rod shape-determining protein MreD [Bacteroidetes bacterium GWF2_43_11]HAQ65132.1 rod shape-determining protein MreD [Bacteroidales bacterium]HBZ66012.1 rod shape-determining protein MreD [Bacteroidales bacterium]